MYASVSKKKSISHVNWDAVYKDPEGVGGDAPWMLPQVMAFLGSKIPLVKNEDGKFSFTKTKESLGSVLSSNTLRFEDGTPVSKQTMANILWYISKPLRSVILPKSVKDWRQVGSLGLRYSRGVPLFLSAFKEFRDIPYSAWDWSDPSIELFLAKEFVELAPYIAGSKELPGFTKEEVLEIRTNAMVYRSGAKQGESRSPTATTNITKCSNKDFSDLPALLQLMLCQCWIYHPSIAVKWSINDITNVDGMPPPLVDSNVFTPPVRSDRIEF